MKKLFLIIPLLVLFAVTGFSQKRDGNEVKTETVVYFCSDITPENILKLYQALNVDLSQYKNVGVKVHFGEEGNQNFLNPELLRPLMSETKATFVETNVLYVSERRFTKSHINLANKHGFNFASIDILDDEGETVYPTPKNFRFCKSVRTGSHFENYDFYIIYSHFKGHGSAGFGGAIKNVGMGMASPGGKMAIHANNYPKVNTPEKCFQCNRCASQCPGDAITITAKGPVIDTAKCIGCAKCIAECPLKIFKPGESASEEVFLERLVEYAKVLSEKNPMVYINVMDNISKSCDCSGKAPAPFMEKVGAVASTDIVAIEMACHQLTALKWGSEDAFKDVNGISGLGQVEYAYKLGMGNKKFVLVDVVTGERISLEDAVK